MKRLNGRVLMATAIAAIALATPARTADVSEAASASVDSNSASLLLRKLDSLERGFDAYVLRAGDQDTRIERFYDRILGHVNTVFVIASALLAAVVGFFGAVYPLMKQRDFRAELQVKLEAQSHEFEVRLAKELADLNQKSQVFIEQVKRHSESLSLAMTHYVFGSFALAEARGAPVALTRAFGSFVDCLSLLRTLLPSPPLPALYVACLQGLKDCGSLRWGQLFQPKVQELLGNLQFLKSVWSNDHAIMALVRDIERWLSGPPDVGIDLSPLAQMHVGSA